MLEVMRVNEDPVRAIYELTEVGQPQPVLDDLPAGNLYFGPMYRADPKYYDFSIYKQSIQAFLEVSLEQSEVQEVSVMPTAYIIIELVENVSYSWEKLDQIIAKYLELKTKQPTSTTILTE